jgi:hypothetical protein
MRSKEDEMAETDEQQWGILITSDLGESWARERFDVWWGTESEARHRALQHSNNTNMHGLKVEARPDYRDTCPHSDCGLDGASCGHPRTG